MGVVTQRVGRVLQRRFADLPIDPCPVDRDRLVVRPECGDDRRHGDVVRRNAGDLGEDQPFPCLVAKASLPPPGLAGRCVKLAVAAVGEGAVVPELPSAHAFEEAAQQVDAIPVLGSPAAGLGAPDWRPGSSAQRAARRRDRRIDPTEAYDAFGDSGASPAAGPLFRFGG